MLASDVVVRGLHWINRIFVFRGLREGERRVESLDQRPSLADAHAIVIVLAHEDGAFLDEIPKQSEQIAARRLHHKSEVFGGDPLAAGYFQNP